MQDFKEDIAEYVKGKTWYVYVPLWLLFAYMFYQVIQITANTEISALLRPISALNFGLHEGSHAVTMWLPSVITAAAGSMSQLLLGAALVLFAVKTRYYFTSVFCSVWFVFAAKDAGQYMSDARTQQLDLVSPFGENAVHDWHYVFDKLHVLNHDTFIGGFVKFSGYACMCASLLFGAWLIYMFAAAKDQKDAKVVEEAKTNLKQTPTSIYPEVTVGYYADSKEAAKTKP